MTVRRRAAPGHVLMTADAVGGVWTYALELARGLSAHGSRVTLAVMGPAPSRAQRSEAALVRGLMVRDRAFKLEWMDEPWEDVARAGEWLLALEREYAPDVVHLNGYAHAVLPFRAPVLVAAHSCVCSWWRAVHGVAAPPAWDRYRAAVRDGVHAADLVVAPTRAMLTALGAEHGTPARARVIPNGRRAATYHTQKEPFILGAGRLWDEAKNTAALAAVASALPWPVYVAGATAEPSGARAEATAVASGVTSLGTLSPSALAGWVARASIFASPVRYEPFGLAALEAALAGCALVLGDIPSQHEVWGDAATFVAPDDHDALRSVLTRLAHDDALRAQMAERARERAARYSVARFVTGYVAAYAQLSTGTRASALSLTA